MSVAFIVVVMFEVTVFLSTLVVWMCVLTLPVKVEVGLESPKGIMRRDSTSGIIEVDGIDVRSGASFIDVCIDVVLQMLGVDVDCKSPIRLETIGGRRNELIA